MSLSVSFLSGTLAVSCYVPAAVAAAAAADAANGLLLGAMREDAGSRFLRLLGGAGGVSSWILQSLLSEGPAASFSPRASVSSPLMLSLLTPPCLPLPVCL